MIIIIINIKCWKSFMQKLQKTDKDGQRRTYSTHTFNHLTLVLLGYLVN